MIRVMTLWLLLTLPVLAGSTEARAGAEWSYPLKVKSRRGGVVVKLESAPDGMRVDGTSTLTWLPREAGTHTVILLASDSSGQETYHTFKVTVR